MAEPALVGRERELEALQLHLDSAVQGKGKTVFVSGEAGSGKTRLVNEFLSASKQKRDITQLAGWCLNNSGVSYFPFIEAFNVYSSSFSKKNGSPSMRQGALQESLEAGFVEHLTKPITIEALLKALQRVARGDSSPTGKE